MGAPEKICVVTSYAAAAEPRAPRHAIAAKLAFPNAEVVLLDMGAAGAPLSPDPLILSGQNIVRQTFRFPTRASGILRLAFRKFRTRVSRMTFKRLQLLNESLFGDRTQGLTLALCEISADIYIAHNIETLIPAFRAAERRDAAVVFDCMEFYSEMGDAQNATEAIATKVLEAKYLPRCALVVASSDLMADALSDEYAIDRPLPAYNVPPCEPELPDRKGGGFNLYWRNSVIGFGQRGLQDALDALVMLPKAVHLYLQGRQTTESKLALDGRIEELDLKGRVHVLPPYAPHEAVRQAALFDVGLCLERLGPRNHDLTVSNKLFDYHMAGLAVVVSDLPPLASVIKRSGGGAVFEPGNPRSLADKIQALIDAPDLLRDMQAHARQFALEKANLEYEVGNIASALRDKLTIQEVIN